MQLVIIIQILYENMNSIAEAVNLANPICMNNIMERANLQNAVAISDDM